MFNPKWDIYIKALIPRLKDPYQKEGEKSVRSRGGEGLNEIVFQIQLGSCTHKLTMVATACISLA